MSDDFDYAWIPVYNDKRGTILEKLALPGGGVLWKCRGTDSPQMAMAFQPAEPSSVTMNLVPSPDVLEEKLDELLAHVRKGGRKCLN